MLILRTVDIWHIQPEWLRIPEETLRLPQNKLAGLPKTRHTPQKYHESLYF
jgi:hypothetical protein